MLIIYAKKENDTCFCCNGYNVMVVMVTIIEQEVIIIVDFYNYNF